MASTGFFAGLLGMLTRVAGAAKAAAGPLGVALGAYALGSVSGTPKPSDAQAFNQALGDFLTAKQQLEQIKSGMDTSGIVSPEQAKAMIAQARAEAISLGAVGQALDYAAKHGISYDDALAKVQKHLQGASSAQQAYAQTLKYVFSNMDAGTSSIADVSGAVTLLNAGLAANTGRMKAFADISGQSTDAIMANLAKVVNDAKSTPQQVADAYQGALDQMRQANQAWHDSIVQTFGGAGSAMDQFANKHVVDIDKAIGSLQDYTKQIHIFDGDIKAIHRRFGKDASDFIQWASQQGLAQAGLVHTVATSSKKDADTFIRQWKRSQDATDQLATDIQQALAPVFNKIIGWLKNVVHAIEGVPPVNIKTQKAEAALRTLDNNIAQMVNSKHTIDIGVHTHPTSPWPDEAIKQHLMDPMKRAGFKQITGAWTLPLHVGVHGDLSGASDLWKRQAEDAATSIVALTNRSGSTPKEGMGIVRRVSQLGSDAAYIKSVASGVGKELNAAQAHHFVRALQLLDKRTMDSGARSDAAIKAALGKMSHLLDGGAGSNADAWWRAATWMPGATAHMPSLPSGNTHMFSQRHHHRSGGDIRVILDRRHYDEAQSFQEDYGRGF